MSKAGRFFMGLFKWLVVPVALGFVGFAFIGPYIGRKPPEALKRIQDKIVTPVTPDPTPVATAADPDEISTEWPAPKVDVELRRLNGERIEDRQTSKRPVMEESTPVTEDAPADAEPAPTDSNSGEEPSADPPAAEPTEPLPDGPGA